MRLRRLSCGQAGDTVCDSIDTEKLSSNYHVSKKAFRRSFFLHFLKRDVLRCSVCFNRSLSDFVSSAAWIPRGSETEPSVAMALKEAIWRPKAAAFKRVEDWWISKRIILKEMFHFLIQLGFWYVW